MTRETTRRDDLVPTIFHEPWWLDAVSDGTWAESTVESGGVLRGRLPYLPDRKSMGLTSLVMPRLTRSLGPAITVTGDADGCVRQPTRHKTVRKLIEGLPRHTHLWMQMHRGVHDTLAFEEAGCVTGVRFTAEIMPAPHGEIWACMRDKTRNVIRRSEDTQTVSAMAVEDFMRFYDAACRAHGRRNEYTEARCSTVLEEAETRRRLRCHRVAGPDGETMAAICTVNDHVSNYYLMSARLPEAGNGAVALLLWNDVRASSDAGLIFDADGLSAENQMLVTGLGGRVRPRLTSTRTTRRHAMLRTVKCAINQLTGTA